VPLGVLALGAVFSGMIWYGSFFGSHDRVNAFFGIPAHHEAAADEEHAEDVAELQAAADEVNAEASGEAGAEEQAATDGAADHGGDMAHAGMAPEGAIYMSPDNHVMDDAHHAPTWVKISPFIAMVIGLLTALWFYIWNPSMPGRVAAANRPLYLFLLNKWYFDEIYDFIFVRPAFWIGKQFWKRGDQNTIDGGINGVAMGIIPFFTRLAGRAQSGYIFTYAFAMVIGIAVFVTWMTIGGGAE